MATQRYRIAREQIGAPFAQGNAQIVRALDEKSIGIDEFVSMRIWILQRVPSVRISMGKGGGRRIKGGYARLAIPSSRDPFGLGALRCRLTWLLLGAELSGPFAQPRKSS